MIRPFSHSILAAIVLSFLGAVDASSQLPQLTVKPSGELTVARAKEDFSCLSLTGSDLHAEPPLLGGKTTTPDYIWEFLRIQWRPNDPVDIYVVRPVGVKNPPVVLYLYSDPTDVDRFKNGGWSKRVTRNGVAAVGFVSAFTGYRAQYHPLNQTFISQLQESLATSVHDVQMVLNYLETRHDLDMTRVGMFGEGSGGAIAILAAKADPRIKALDLLAPWGDWPDWLAKSSQVPDKERAKYLKPDFLERLGPLEPVRYLPDLKSRRIRMQFEDNDTTEPKQVVSKLEFSAPPTATTVVHYPGVEEFWAASSGGRLFDWITNGLKPAAETKTVSSVSKEGMETQPAR